MKIFIEKENKTIEILIKTPTTIKKILREHKIPLESVILVKNDKICFEDENVCNNDEIKLLSVVSGG